jgi:two-component system response regulator CpxR
VNLLLIDDDAELCALLSEYLRSEGFETSYVHSGLEGIQAIQNALPDLIVLDVMLPGINGFEVLRRIRARSRVPVIMLTARGRDEDRITGLDLGADDYLPKPFNSRELVARIRAIRRRSEAQRNDNQRLEVNGIRIDPGRREVFRDDQPVTITTFEFDILDLLMRNAGRVVSRDELMEHLYNRKATAFDRSIDMHVSHLRKKLEVSESLIKTVRGVGYLFAAPEAAPAK